MPATEVVDQDITGLTGVVPSYAAANVAGNYIQNDGRIILQFKNTNGATRTVTFNSLKACEQGSDHNVAVTIDATSGNKFVGPFSQERFNDGSGQVGFTYDVVADLTVAAFKVGSTPLT